MGRRQRSGDIGARAEAGIYQSRLLQPLQRFGIARGPLRLDDGLAVMREAEPCQILENVFDEFGAAAASVEILDPQQESTAAGPRVSVAQSSRKSMAEVESSGGRRGKTCDLQDSLHSKGYKADS